MDNKYDIGILTFWSVPNYGTFAQAYALQKVLQSINNDKDVRQISHLDEHHYNFYYNKKAYYRIWSRSYWKEIIKSIVKKDNSIKKENIFLDAYNTIPHTINITKESVAEISFEKIFLGSDIVWDFTLEPFNRDPMLFGEYFNSKEINAYAASFGTVKKNTIIPDYVKNSIKRMKYISVRDENSADIVESLTGKRPIVVLDPAWMWDFANDSQIQVPDDNNYILVYGQDFTDNFVQNLILYAKRNHMQIIVLDCNNDNYAWCDVLVKQENLNPYLWIGYFKKASIVATSTFHGLTFGLIFKKKIAFCKSDFIIAKIGTFLKQIKLYDLFDNQDDVENMLEYHWNYKDIDEFIQKEREQSIKFLKKACD